MIEAAVMGMKQKEEDEQPGSMQQGVTELRERRRCRLYVGWV